MPNWINSAREFLGLGQDPYYEDYDEGEPYTEPGGEPEAQGLTRGRPAAPPAPAPAPTPAPTGPGNDWDEGDGGVRVITTVAEPSGVPDAGVPGDRNVVRPLPNTSHPDIVSPTRFDDGQEVADSFKRSRPVVLNLQGVDRDLSRRLIDFASGLCYGLDGRMERVTDQVFLLTPNGAAVSEDDLRRFSEGRLEPDDS